jgi:hypothetical protein
MTKLIKKLYARYFQKSRSFLLPILGIKKDTAYPCINSYLCWTGIYSLSDYKLILTYDKADDDKWNKYLLNILMSNPMFDEYHESDDDHIVISFDLHSVKDDYEHVIFGRYSKLSKLTKGKIRTYYGYETPEYAYLESFLYPEKFIGVYSKLLDVDPVHILHTGELCDKPDMEKETLKIKLYVKLNDVDKINVEPKQNI